MTATKIFGAMEQARPRSAPFTEPTNTHDTGVSHLVFDGMVIATDRCLEKTTSVRGQSIDLWYSGKDHHHAGNVQGVMGADGLPLCISDVEPGSVHDLPAARTHVLGELYAFAAKGLPALADLGYEGAGIGVITGVSLGQGDGCVCIVRGKGFDVGDRFVVETAPLSPAYSDEPVVQGQEGTVCGAEDVGDGFAVDVGVVGGFGAGVRAAEGEHSVVSADPRDLQALWSEPPTGDRNLSPEERDMFNQVLFPGNLKGNYASAGQQKSVSADI